MAHLWVQDDLEQKLQLRWRESLVGWSWRLGRWLLTEAKVDLSGGEWSGEGSGVRDPSSGAEPVGWGGPGNSQRIWRGRRARELSVFRPGKSQSCKGRGWGCFRDPAAEGGP